MNEKYSHAEWVARYNLLRGIADRICAMRREAAWALAATVGIPRCGCSLHNASIDTNLKGWCHNNPKRLKVAKAARRIFDSQFDGYRIVESWDKRVRGY